MDLQPYVDDIQRQLEAAADAGGEEARALAKRLAAPLDAAIRLSLLDAMSAAAQEITCDLAPGSVELRLRGGVPGFAVTAPGDREAAGDPDPPADGGPMSSVAALGAPAGDEGSMARLNLRMPERLRERIDLAAAAEGLSVNAWLMRAAAAAVERATASGGRERRSPQGAHRFTGWARS